MADKIIKLLPGTDTKGLDEIIAEQDAYYGKSTIMREFAAKHEIPFINHPMVKLTDDSEARACASVIDIVDDPPAKIDISKMVFVFGSNERGLHGAGAARYARIHRGAAPGLGVGHFGQSYAIPTKDWDIQSLPLTTIKDYVDRFLAYASYCSHHQFQVTAIGCGLAGFTNAQIAPMFIGASDNCWFDESWRPYLDNVKFWGTF